MADNAQLTALYEGTIINRNDPMGLGRVRFTIPGILEPQSVNEGPWAFPRGGGARRWGKNDVPPLGADVFVQFVNGDPERPVYEPAHHGKPNGETEAFPEFDDPDVHVWGRGPFRLVIDNREGQQSATLKIVKEILGVEDTVAAITLNYEDNAISITADSAIGIESSAIIDIDAPVVQILRRKVTPTAKPIN
jgi:hypothetical protein